MRVKIVMVPDKWQDFCKHVLASVCSGEDPVDLQEPREDREGLDLSQV